MNTPPADPPKPRPATWAVVLAFALVYTTWGTTYLAIKVGVHDEALPPALFGGTRTCVAGLLVLGFLALRGQSLRLERRDLGRLLLGSTVMFVGGNGLINLAETTVPSGAAAVLAATTPLWVALVGWCWPGGERLGWVGWCGLLIGLGGVCLMLAPKLGDPATLFHDLGPLFVLGSAASWGFGSVLMRYRPLRMENHLAAAGYQLLVGGALLSLIGLAVGEADRLPAQWTARAVTAYFYLLIVGSLLGFIAYNWLLGHVPATQASTYAYVNPVVAVLVAWVAGEEMTVWIVAGIAVILAGVALVRGAGRRAVLAVPPAEEMPVVVSSQATAAASRVS